MAHGDSWIAPFRTTVALDAAQTFGIRGSRGEFRESNPLYAGMGDAEAGLSVLAVGWGVERAITGIRDHKWREFVGWLATAIEFNVVRNNMRVGVRVRF